MRILYFIDGLGRGGKERRLIQLLRFVLERNAAEVELVMMSREIAYPEFHGLDIKTEYLIRKGNKDLRIFQDLYRICRRFQPDIIHTWDSMTSVYAAPVARLSGTRFINGMITNTPPGLKPFTSLWLRSRITFLFSDAIVANSQAGLVAYNAPARKSVCIRSGIDQSRILNLPDQETVRRDIGIKTPRVVGMVAEFSDKKDYCTFILAAHKVLATRDDVTFLAVGGGKHLERCKSLVRAQYRERVKFLGWQERVECIMNIMDIGVLATYTEGISNSILEFMALGKPMVATDGGGTKEIVEHGVTGFLVPARDAGQLAGRISELLCDRDACRSLGERGRDRALNLFGIETMGNQFLRLYERVNEKGY